VKMSDKAFAFLFSATGFSLGFSVCALLYYDKVEKAKVPTPAPTCHCRCCNDAAPTIANPFTPAEKSRSTIVLPEGSGTITAPQDWEPSGTTTIPLAAEDRP